MAKRLTVAQVVQRWADRGAASGDTVRNGVNAVTESPMEKAAARKDAWLAGVQRAAQSGKYENNLRAVSLQDWKQSMLNKGIANMQNGYTNGKAKFTRFMNEWMPYAQQISDQIKQMPKGTLQQGIDRATAAIRMAAAFKRGTNYAPMPRPAGG
jgi:hypothetical protein